MSIDDRFVRLACPTATAIIDPRRGARVAALTVNGVEVFGASNDSAVPPAMRDGCFAMAPFAGRIADGHLRFDDRSWLLPVNLGGSAAHGMAFDAAWEVDDSNAAMVECVRILDGRWPFGGVVRQRVSLHQDGISIVLTLQNDDRAMPGMLGLHPWFARRQAGSDADLVVDLGGQAAFAGMAPGQVPKRPWDHCVTNLRSSPQAMWGNQDESCLRLKLESSTTSWLVYEGDPDAFCLEPLSAPLGRLGQVNGPVVEPGAPIELSMRIRLCTGEEER